MNRIKELRAEMGIYQSELAKLLKVRQNTISTWETGRSEPDQAALREMSKIFDVSIDYILGNSNIKKAPSAEALSTTPEAEALREVMKSLSPEDRQRVLDFGRGLAATAHKPKQPK